MKRKMLAHNCTYHENKIFCISTDANIVFTIDCNNESIELMDLCPNEKLFGKYLFSDIYIHRDEIILIPCNADKICIYHMDDRCWEYIYLPHKSRGISFKFSRCIVIGGWIYLIANCYREFLRLNLATHILEELDLYKQISSRIPKNENTFLHRDYIEKSEIIFTPVIGTNKLLQLDFYRMEAKLLQIGAETNKYMGITEDAEGNYWLSPRKNTSIVKYTKNGEVMEFSLPKDFQDDNYHFSGAYELDGKIVFPGMPGIGNKSLLFTPDDPNDYRVIVEGEIFYKRENQFFAKQDNNGVLTYRKYDDKKKIHCMISNKDIKKWITKYMTVEDSLYIRKVIGEDVFFNLELYLSIIGMEA